MFQNKCILVVEDDPDWMDEICEILSEYDLIKASSVREAKGALENKKIDLIVLDLGLSETSGINGGLAILEHVKLEETDLQCIVFTGRDLPIDKAQDLFKKYRIFAGLKKPEDIAQLSTEARLALRQEAPPMEHYPVIKILFLAATPYDMENLAVDKEYNAIVDVMLKSKFRDRFEIRYNPAVQVTKVQEVLLRFGPHIVHFSGHGSKGKEIVLLDANGNSHPVSISALEKLFELLKKNIRCVVLNACYSEPQAEAIARNIDCVIGMSDAITDQSAIAFSTAFYQALGNGENVKAAFELGCNQIGLDALGEEEVPNLLALITDPQKIIFAA